MHLINSKLLTKSMSGYTLIELIMVMLILAILYFAAGPLYGNYRIRAERSQGIAAMLQASMWAEQGYSISGKFPSPNDLPVAFRSVPYPAEKDFSGNPKSPKYLITMQTLSTGGESGYLIVAERADKKDDLCPYFTIDHLGTKSNAKNGSESGFISTCWSQ